MRYWPEKGKSGFLVWRYLLRRDDTEPGPWTKEGKDRIKKLGLTMQVRPRRARWGHRVPGLLGTQPWVLLADLAPNACTARTGGRPALSFIIAVGHWGPRQVPAPGAPGRRAPGRRAALPGFSHLK